MAIAQRLAARKTPSSAEDLHAFHGWKADIEQKALEKARLSVKHEIDSHEDAIAKHDALVEAAVARAEVAEARMETIMGKFAGMEKDIASKDRALLTVKSSWSATKEKLQTTSKDTGSEILIEKIKSEQLGLKVALLEGRITELKNIKPPVIVPTVRIPSFKFEPIRGADGRTISLTATPIGIN